MVDARELTPQERALIRRVLEAAAFEGASRLMAQVDAAGVTGGLTTLLDLEVGPAAPAADVADGPIPVRALVEGPQGSIEGEILIWVRDGYLSGLEFAWVSDEAPDAMPSPDQVKVQQPLSGHDAAEPAKAVEVELPRDGTSGPAHEQIAALRDLLNGWDPLGVHPEWKGAPHDEYDDLLKPLLARLRRGASTDRIAAFLRRRLTWSYGVGPDESRPEDVASRIVEWYRRESHQG
jgi:hypothetical protein